MKKTVIIINGAGGVGKDTLCEIASRHYKVVNVSSITPIKQIAAECGWDGSKDDRSRRFLSELKRLTVEYNDYPTLWALQRYREFLSSDAEIMFVHIREPEEIAKLVEGTDGAAVTLLIRGGQRMQKSHYGNRSDDCVEDYKYDHVFYNDKSLEEAERDFIRLLRNITEEKNG